MRAFVGEDWSEGAMRRTCAWSVLVVKGTCLLYGGVERGSGCSRNALEVDVDARKGHVACTIPADEAAVKTMSGHGEDVCFTRKSRGSPGRSCGKNHHAHRPQDVQQAFSASQQPIITPLAKTVIGRIKGTNVKLGSSILLCSLSP